MLLTAQEASDKTNEFIVKNNARPRTELDDVVDLIEMAIRRGHFHLEIDGELKRETIDILKNHGYLVGVVRVEREVAYVTTWSK